MKKSEVISTLKANGTKIFALASFDLPSAKGYKATLPAKEEEIYTLGAVFERDKQKYQLLFLHANVSNDAENFGMQAIPTTDKKVLELAPKTKIEFSVSDYVSKTTGRAGKAANFNWNTVVKAKKAETNL